MSRFSSVVVARLPGIFLTTALFGFTGPALSNEVDLVSNDGDTRLRGHLLGFDGQTYQIETVIGEISALADVVRCEGAGCPVKNITYSWGTPEIGGLVSITADDGGVKLGGTLQSFSDGQAVISTEVGDLTVALSDAECTGPGCPPIIETVDYVIPDLDSEETAKQEETGQQVASAAIQQDAEHVSTDSHSDADHSAEASEATQTVSDTFYPDPGIDTPYEVPPEIRMAGPGEVVEILMPVALENYAWRHNGVLDLFDDHMATTEDIGELKHHEGGVGYEIKDADGDRLFGLLGHHVHVPNEQIQMLADNETDVAFISGPVTDEEVAIIANAGYGNLNDINQQRVVAVDGFVAIVSPENPVDRIALSDLRRVFAGEIDNWSQLGGPDAPINLYTFPTGHETFYKTRDVLLRPAGFEVSPDANERRLTREIIESVVTDPNGIGFVSYARRRGAKVLPLVMECGLEVDATPLTIKTERYPLVERIAAFSRNGEQTELVSDFLNFVESSDFDAGAEKAGFVSLSVEDTPLEQDAQRFNEQLPGYSNATEINRAGEILTLMEGRSSLSSAFRFRTGSAQLDQRAERDLKRVVEFINENPEAEYTVVGFADSVGAFPQNEVLSLRRAQSVISSLRRADPSGRLSAIELQAIGAGELNAVACNDSEAERSTNRRVEIWMKR